MTVPSPTGALLPLGPVPGRRQASSAAVGERAAQRKEAHWIGFPQSDARRPASVGREPAFSAAIACEPDRRGRMSLSYRGPRLTVLSSSPLPSSIPPASDGSSKAADALTPTA